jgi:hypothetical protein
LVVALDADEQADISGGGVDGLRQKWRSRSSHGFRLLIW